MNIQIIIVPCQTHARNKQDPDLDTHIFTAVEGINVHVCMYNVSTLKLFPSRIYDSPKRIGKRVTKTGLVASGPEAMPCARIDLGMAMVGFRMTRRMMKMTKHGTC